MRLAPFCMMFLCHLPLRGSAFRNIAPSVVSGLASVPAFRGGSDHRSPYSKQTRLLEARSSLKEVSKTGEFKRVDSAWRNWISRGW